MAYVALLNTKGGSGKSTLATNLAAWLARSNGGAALVDYDEVAKRATEVRLITVRRGGGGR